MQMVKKIIAIVFLFWFAVNVMMPKQELYFLLEQELDKSDIKISSEKISEGWFSLRISEPSIFVKGIKVATVEEISLFSLLFYTEGSLEGIVLDSSLARFAPENIEELTLTHSVFAPKSLWVDAKGIFGKADGEVNLVEKKLTMKFSQIEKLGVLKSRMKKDEEGWLYETSF